MSSQKKKKIITLDPGLYEIKDKIYFLGYQTDVYATFIELYNESGEGYCCTGTGKGLRHPAAGVIVKKTSARKLESTEITKRMKEQWNTRIKEACNLVMGSECKRKHAPRKTEIKRSKLASSIENI